MSILIAYIIIGFTLSVPFAGTDKRVGRDSFLSYAFDFLVMTIFWPAAVWAFAREVYRKLFS